MREIILAVARNLTGHQGCRCVLLVASLKIVGDGDVTLPDAAWCAQTAPFAFRNALSPVRVSEQKIIHALSFLTLNSL